MVRQKRISVFRHRDDWNRAAHRKRIGELQIVSAVVSVFREKICQILHSPEKIVIPSVEQSESLSVFQPRLFPEKPRHAETFKIITESAQSQSIFHFLVS